MLIFKCSYDRIENVDGDNRALIVGCFYIVAFLKGLEYKKHQTARKICKRPLERKTDRNASGSEQGEKRRFGNTEHDRRGHDKKDFQNDTDGAWKKGTDGTVKFWEQFPFVKDLQQPLYEFPPYKYYKKGENDPKKKIRRVLEKIRFNLFKSLHRQLSFQKK